MRTRGDALTEVLEEVMGWTLAVMLLLVFGNVVLRYGFNSGIPISEELARYLFVGMTFMGAVVGLHRRQHLGLDMLVQRLPSWGRRFAAIFGHLVMLLCCAVLFWGSLEQMKVNQGNRSPAMDMPLSIIYGGAAFAGLVMTLILLVSLFRLLTGRATADDLKMSTDDAEQAMHEVDLVTASIHADEMKVAGARK
jgi:TRAP-type C4-dicarboxylate transport system permease small subunit